MTTQTLSFRNLTKFILIKENEIQQRESPFKSGQYTTMTAELAAVKLLLTGVDDSSVVKAVEEYSIGVEQIALIDELLLDLINHPDYIEGDHADVLLQLKSLNSEVENSKRSLSATQVQLDSFLARRHELLKQRTRIQDRLDEVFDLLTRFRLLHEHYKADIYRLEAIQESGSMFAYIDLDACPLCGVTKDSQHLEETCESNVGIIVKSATAEISKINKLLKELDSTVKELVSEKYELVELFATKDAAYREIESFIIKTAGPEVNSTRNSFSELIEKRANIKRSIDIFIRQDKLKKLKDRSQEGSNTRNKKGDLQSVIPDLVAYSFSQKVSFILNEWNFPGAGHVHYDKKSSDFLINGKLRSSYGKGLRAITHAAVSIALLEHCQENGLSHPGFIVLDSPLLAYFKPEGEEDQALIGSDLKERFYEYLIKHHGESSQVIVIENEHPPQSVRPYLSLSVFTSNSDDGRFGLL